MNPMNLQENSNALRPRLTVGILTLNEEKRIASCINSAKFADQILVIDSGSQDKTRDIAAALGAEVLSTPIGRALPCSATAYSNTPRANTSSF